jgi:hypothetical protein
MANNGIDKLLRNPNLQQAKKLYDELFSIGDLNASSPLFARGREDRHTYLTYRGFKKIDYEEAQCLDLNSLRSGSGNVHYLKLHGSLDWWVRDDKKIVLDGYGKPTYGEKFIDRILIYPIYEKSISKEPFSSLYAAFPRRRMRRR